MVISVEARGASLAWNEPTLANGIIQKYEVFSTSLRQPDTQVKHWEGLANSVVLTDLIPYTYYTFKVRACTTVGCLLSLGVEAETDAAPPTNQLPPNITAVSPTELLIQWSPPLYPNGKVAFFTRFSIQLSVAGKWLIETGRI